MTTKATVEHYFDQLRQRSDWPSSFADDVVFTSATSPVKQVKGKGTYLERTKGFYSMIRSCELRELMVDGDRAVALTRYELAPPNGAPHFKSDVAEIFTVKNDRITALDIYFDSVPFPK
jgi:ketosteroid isomerase-like protein